MTIKSSSENGIINVSYHVDNVGESITSYGSKNEVHSISMPDDLSQVTYSWNEVEVIGKKTQNGPIFRRLKKQEVTTKIIVDNVSGVVHPGEFVAIMGASGAGKTTLLNALTFRTSRKLKVRGNILLNGRKADSDTVTRVSAYVQQVDLFIGTLTVREHLRFQAKLRMDKGIPFKERMNRVEEVIQELGLSKCADTLIGIPGRLKGISGGEMKRLAFASELITNPPLLFCDEPTSGLDSYMAQTVVTAMKQMAAKRKTIICTIHQPSSEVYAMFDRVLLMAEGRVAYMGSAAGALAFFESINLRCPTNFNPADFFVQKLAVVPGREIESRQEVKRVCDAFQESPEGKLILKESKVAAESETSGDFTVRKRRSPYKANWFQQLGAVLQRSIMSVFKEPSILTVKLFQTIFIALLVAAIYWGQDVTTSAGVQNISGALFIFLTNMTFQNVFGVVDVFTREVPIFMREHFNGMYRTDVYFLSKMLSEALLYIALPFVFTAIPYYAIGLNPAVDRFFMACFIVVLVGNVAVSYGYMMSCIATSTQMALALAAPFIIPFLLFGGFFLNSLSVPVYFVWLKYLSWFLYANEALNINQFQGLDKIGCVPGPQNITEICLTPDDLFERLGFQPDNLWFDIGMLFVLIAAFRLVAFLALLAKTYRKG
ncbi:protein white-like isoform X2 [Artemia franciscana]|uniref:Protein white n=1 Tax=Artemia franciscana TaxID=6661 RepID=A0AA88KSR4_ARTSF|nr:hypothetical protein QYM36_020105 [Artemia franciscana]